MQIDPAVTPPARGFSQVWHAQVLAMADELIKAGFFSAQDWAEALGAEIQAADVRRDSDTEDTYFLSALAALEFLCGAQAGLSPEMLNNRKVAWEDAYHATPHGQPVVLADD